MKLRSFILRPCLAAFLLVSTTAALYAAPGDLDGRFNTFGFQSYDFGTGPISGYDITVARDGKIVVVGGKSGTSFHVARFNTNGSFDNTFDGNGKASTALGFSFMRATRVALQRDDKPVVFGSVQTGTSNSVTVARYLVDGALDPSFNSTGTVTFDVGDLGSARALAIQKDGKILLAASSQKTGPSGPIPRVQLLRLNPNGKLDPTFGQNGRVFTAVGDAAYPAQLAIQPDGKILVSGAVGNSASTSAFLLIRYSINGQLDPSFGKNGIVSTNTASSFERANGLALLPNGKILLAGGNSTLALVRYKSNGSLDSSFGTNGIVIASTNDNAEGQGGPLAVQRDGKIIIGGYADGPVNLDMLFRRFTKNGQPDETFGPNGRITLDLGENDSVDGLVLQKDGMITFCGARGDAMITGRILGGPHPADARVGKTPLVPKGDNFFNFDGIGSTQNATLANGETRTLFFAVENEGIGNSSYTLFGTSGNGDFEVKYFRGQTDITALLNSASYTSSVIKPGKRFLVAVRVKALNAIPGTTHTLNFNAFSTLDSSGDSARIELQSK